MNINILILTASAFIAYRIIDRQSFLKKLSAIDGITAKKILELDKRIQKRALKFCIDAKKAGINIRIYSAYRSLSEQAELYAQGRTETGPIVTNAKPGNSWHNYGLAFDAVEIKNGQALWTNPNWPIIGKIGKDNGFDWGGDWVSIKDKPHFQKTFGKKISQMPNYVD